MKSTPTVRLTQTLAVHRLHRRGLTGYQIAEKLGLNPRTVYRYLATLRDVYGFLDELQSRKTEARRVASALRLVLGCEGEE